MRILFTIPHYYGPGPAHYGSTDASQRVQRITSLRSCITALHQHFGCNQNLLLYGGEACPVNQALSNDIDIVVCVNGSNHILDELHLPPGSFRSREFDLDNSYFLGFSCYEVLREASGHYDWYCYLEDDIVIADPLFFCKLQAFYRVENNARYLLQPNRYELGENPTLSKAYIDGPLWSDSAEFLAGLRLPGCRDEIPVNFGATTFRTTPALNPHSGCFFLTNAHLLHLLEQPWFGDRSVGYAGPLESAATQYIITLFHVFKPALECASFLEVHHQHQKYIGVQSAQPVHADTTGRSFFDAPIARQAIVREIVGNKDTLKVGLALFSTERSEQIGFSSLIDNITIQQRVHTEFFLFNVVNDTSVTMESRLISFRNILLSEYDAGVISTLLTEMDIVISCDNQIACYATELGKPLWLLIPFDIEEGKIDSIVDSWPQATIFKQQRPGDWGHVFLNISLFQSFSPTHLDFKPFSVSGITVAAPDTLPLPPFHIETTDMLSELLSLDMARLTNVQIETTSVCNLRCSYCPNSTVGRPAKFMEDSVFHKIIDSLKNFDSEYCGTLSPHFYGEPLMDSRLEKFVWYMRQNLPLSQIQLYSNGELLTTERYLSLKDAGVDVFKITQHTPVCSQTLSNTLSFIQKNHPDLFTVEYSVADDSKSMFMNRGGLVELEPASDEMLKIAFGCVMAYRVMTFDCNGNAVLCCNDYLSQHSFGNIQEKSLAEIWHGLYYKQIRNRTLLGNMPLKICRVCMFNEPR